MGRNCRRNIGKGTKANFARANPGTKDRYTFAGMFGAVPCRIVAMVGASAALTLSGVPFFGPIAAARVAMIDGAYVLNPTLSQSEVSNLDLIVAGTKEGVLMVESEASELSEADMLGAVNFGHQQMQVAIDAIIDLAESAAKEPRDLPQEAPEAAPMRKTLAALRDKMSAAYGHADKSERQSAVAVVRSEASSLAGEGADSVMVGSLMKEMESDIVVRGTSQRCA